MVVADHRPHRLVKIRLRVALVVVAAAEEAEEAEEVVEEVVVVVCHRWMIESSSVLCSMISKMVVPHRDPVPALPLAPHRLIRSSILAVGRCLSGPIQAHRPVG